jgi:hypothetical protein
MTNCQIYFIWISIILTPARSTTAAKISTMTIFTGSCSTKHFFKNGTAISPQCLAAFAVGVVNEVGLAAGGGIIGTGSGIKSATNSRHAYAKICAPNRIVYTASSRTAVTFPRAIIRSQRTCTASGRHIYIVFYSSTVRGRSERFFIPSSTNSTARRAFKRYKRACKHRSNPHTIFPTRTASTGSTAAKAVHKSINGGIRIQRKEQKKQKCRPSVEVYHKANPPWPALKPRNFPQS